MKAVGDTLGVARSHAHARLYRGDVYNCGSDRRAARDVELQRLGNQSVGFRRGNRLRGGIELAPSR